MKRFPALILTTAILLSPWRGTAYAEDEYKPPYPHSTGAQLLPYCQASDVPIDLLRCDYYVQGVADLATTPVKGERLACIPRGKNRTELMELAVAHLTSLEPHELENTSAASLILGALRKEYRCPKRQKKEATPAQLEAYRQFLINKAKEKKANQTGEAGKP